MSYMNPFYKQKLTVFVARQLFLVDIVMYLKTNNYWHKIFQRPRNKN